MDFSLTRRFQMDQRLMMDAQNLAKFSFFQRCGVFGVTLDSQRDRAEGLLHAVSLLREPSERRCLIIYPQGRLSADWEEAPFEGGLEAILKRAPEATALPVWRHFHHGKHELPEVGIQLGAPIPGSEQPTTQVLENALNVTKMALFERLKSDAGGDALYLSKRVKALRGET